MAEGIHVTYLPENATEKQLKVYFSNPRNGGGHIKQILFPLPHDSAVILFENPDTVRDIVKKGHVLREHRLSVCALPKQIFGSTKVELEKSVSHYIERNPPVVDELQYVGELKVDFHYEKEIYILQGGWYQLEWALHYLDGLLGDSDLRMKGQGQGQQIQEQWQHLREEYPELPDETDEHQPIKHEIRKPNIPMVKQPKDVKEKEAAKSNKKVPIGVTVKKAEKQAKTAKYDGKTVRQNLHDRGKEKQHFAADYERYSKDVTRQAKGAGKAYQNILSNSESDDDNYGTYYTRGGYRDQFAEKAVSFSKETDFSENKPRPRKDAPKRTMGINVAQTDFGEVPLMHEFTLPNDLKVQVTMDDITKQSTDGIINPTNSDLSSMFGASRAIVQAGGYEMQKEMMNYQNKNGNLDWAEVFHTKSGGTLPKKVINVIHTASPLWNEDDSDTATHFLVCTYINCFMYADNKLWHQSLATPVISAGAFGFPLDICIQAFYDAVLLFSIHGQATYHLKEIRLICFDEDTSMAAIVILQSLFDCDSTQAVYAATERYNNACLKSKFSAENFSTEVSSKTVKEAFTTNKNTRTKQQVNKNAQRQHKNKTDEVYEGQDDDMEPLDVVESGMEGDAAGRGSKDNKSREKVINLEKDDSDEEEDTDDKKQMDVKRANIEEKDENKIHGAHSMDIRRVSAKSGLRRSSNDHVVHSDSDEGRKSPVEGTPFPDDKIDAKKSLAGIDRPKFTDPEGESDGPDDSEDFDIGIIGSDKYSKKFEDLIVSVNQTNESSEDEDDQEENPNGEKEQDVKYEQVKDDMESYKEEGHGYTDEHKSDTDKDNEEDNNEMDNKKDDQAFGGEEETESCHYKDKPEERRFPGEHKFDSYNDDIHETDKKQNITDEHGDDLEIEDFNKEELVKRSFEENEDGFVIMSEEDAEINAALDRALSFQADPAVDESAINVKPKVEEVNNELLEEEDEYLEEYTGPKVLDTDI